MSTKAWSSSVVIMVASLPLPENMNTYLRRLFRKNRQSITFKPDPIRPLVLTKLSTIGYVIRFETEKRKPIHVSNLK